MSKKSRRPQENCRSEKLIPVHFVWIGDPGRRPELSLKGPSEFAESIDDRYGIIYWVFDEYASNVRLPENVSVNSLDKLFDDNSLTDNDEFKQLKTRMLENAMYGNFKELTSLLIMYLFGGFYFDTTTSLKKRKSDSPKLMLPTYDRLAIPNCGGHSAPLYGMEEYKLNDVYFYHSPCLFPLTLELFYMSFELHYLYLIKSPRPYQIRNQNTSLYVCLEKDFQGVLEKHPKILDFRKHLVHFYDPKEENDQKLIYTIFVIYNDLCCSVDKGIIHFHWENLLAAPVRCGLYVLNRLSESSGFDSIFKQFVLVEQYSRHEHSRVGEISFDFGRKFSPDYHVIKHSHLSWKDPKRSGNLHDVFRERESLSEDDELMRDLTIDSDSSKSRHETIFSTAAERHRFELRNPVFEEPSEEEEEERRMWNRRGSINPVVGI